MSKIGGTAFIAYDGNQLQLAGDMTVSPDDVEREGKAGLSGVAGFTETNRVPFIEGTFFTVPELSITEISEITDATVTAELGNGRSYVLRNAWVAGTRELNVADGTVGIKFEGVSCKEI
ncbi:MAG: phage tail protein [Rhodobiaceae bacterium]|nr:MAG: phage tail protein [Rhodobiaceae bacterium]